MCVCVCASNNHDEATNKIWRFVASSYPQCGGRHFSVAPPPLGALRSRAKSPGQRRRRRAHLRAINFQRFDAGASESIVNCNLSSFSILVRSLVRLKLVLD